MKTSTAAIKYGDVTVIDACTLMSSPVLEETGFGDVQTTCTCRRMCKSCADA